MEHHLPPLDGQEPDELKEEDELNDPSADEGEDAQEQPKASAVLRSPLRPSQSPRAEHVRRCERPRRRARRIVAPSWRIPPPLVAWRRRGGRRRRILPSG